MSVTVTGKLSRTPNNFKAADSTGFGINFGVKYYDRETKKSNWTNYKCVVFIKSDQQVQFYLANLIEGATVTISGLKQKIDVFNGNNGPIYTIEILNATIEHLVNPNAEQSNTAQQPQAQPQAQQQVPAQQPNQYAQQPNQYAQQSRQDYVPANQGYQQQGQPQQEQGPDIHSDVPF